MASISDFALSIAILKAGRKSSVLISEKGAVLYTVSKYLLRMLINMYLNVGLL